MWAARPVLRGLPGQLPTSSSFALVCLLLKLNTSDWVWNSSIYCNIKNVWQDTAGASPAEDYQAPGSRVSISPFHNLAVTRLTRKMEQETYLKTTRFMYHGGANHNSLDAKDRPTNTWIHYSQWQLIFVIADSLGPEIVCHTSFSNYQTTDPNDISSQAVIRQSMTDTTHKQSTGCA